MLTSSRPLLQQHVLSNAAKIWNTTIRIPNLKAAVPVADSIFDIDQTADLVVDLLRHYQGKVLVMTGAGASTDSGIPDYRGTQGTYVRNPKHRPILFQELISSEDFRRRYWARGYLGWPEMSKAQANPTHYLLAQLLRDQYIQHIITQNVDHLHHLAGTSPQHVTELHGSLREVECLSCRTSVDRDLYQRRLNARNPKWANYARSLQLRGEKPKTNPDGDVELPGDITYTDFDIPPCHVCSSRKMKPKVVFFGENIQSTITAQAENQVRDSSAMLIIGSSLATYSSYRLVRLANELSKPIGIINLGATRADGLISWKAEVGCSPVLEHVVRKLSIKP
ncbi:DHS-like NAD/FAD-binding domain-containing protein [Radiomyces spectabilis]|uniref:DHS-like NAD/FAD-binding domain-containing protein n=1 Tax=Radiomyces spectabilis TaxID=64574 RepID=UPI00221F7D5B|nr:DHS-like NAD/FAD-binding domain-containing protein [Radiomyces spectabilis]KAI8381321.1 DHS-like NAD/FAD-binding domain-containing protein [Radiomyces spectabilis]